MPIFWVATSYLLTSPKRNHSRPAWCHKKGKSPPDRVGRFMRLERLEAFLGGLNGSIGTQTLRWYLFEDGFGWKVEKSTKTLVLSVPEQPWALVPILRHGCRPLRHHFPYSGVWFPPSSVIGAFTEPVFLPIEGETHIWNFCQELPAHAQLACSAVLTPCSMQWSCRCL